MLRFVMAAVCCVLLCDAALAAPADRPCKADIDKYCAAARGDRAQMGQCMRDHFTDFSEACQAKMKERAQAQGGPEQPHAPGERATGAPPPAAGP